MANVKKRMCLPVGSYTKDGKVVTEYRDIGVIIEFSDSNGNTWEEARLNLDILNPSLLMLARGQCDKTSSTGRVKLFSLERKENAKAKEADADAGMYVEDIPF